MLGNGMRRCINAMTTESSVIAASCLGSMEKVEEVMMLLAGCPLPPSFCRSMNEERRQ